MSATFAAKYRGHCGACLDEIEPGDVCAYSDDVLVHEDCTQVAIRVEQPRPVCGRCFMETAANGACGCDE